MRHHFLFTEWRKEKELEFEFRKRQSTTIYWAGGGGRLEAKREKGTERTRRKINRKERKQEWQKHIWMVNVARDDNWEGKEN